MTLANGAHVQIGNVYFMVDEEYDLTNKRAYDHYGRSLFSGTNLITGKPGSQNLNPDTLFWHLTDYDGEGQVVLNANDNDSARHFYRSEGLNFRVPGEFSLNPSTAAQSPTETGGTTTTLQGNADFSDVTGTSTTSGTDRKLTVVADKVKSSNYTPGAKQVEAQFYLYREAPTSTQVLGSAMNLERGSGKVSGAYFQLTGGTARTTSAAMGTQAVKVEWYAHCAATLGCDANVKIVDNTNANNPKTIYVSPTVRITGTTRQLVASTVFTPLAGKTYRFLISGGRSNAPLYVEDFDWELDAGTNTATLEIYNETGTATVKTQTVSISSTAAGVLSGTLVFTAAAATNYSYRVTRTAGPLKIVLDKVISLVQSSSTWSFDLAELGQGGSVWLTGHTGVADGHVWRYDTTTNTWTDTTAPLTGTAGATCYAMAHTDKYQYMLMSDRKVYRTNGTAGAGNTEAYTAAITGTQIGMCIAQDRVFVLAEDSTNGVIVRTFAVDDVAPPTATLASATVSTGKNTADTTLRQRMCSSPTGARFFVNYSDVTCKIYEADASGASLVVKQLDELGHGVKATAIAYEGGITFIVGQYVAESDQTPRSALWIIDANGVLQRIGYFRRDDPNANVPISITPYQSDLFILQGPFVWRYSLTAGGLFLEYQLQPTAGSNQRSMTVLQSRTIAVYSDEIWATGSVGTYRQSGTSGANQLVSSVYDFGLPGVTKLLTDMTILCDTLPGNTAVQAEVQLDQTGTWISLGTMTTGAVASFQGSDEVTQRTFNTIQLRVTPVSLTGTATPKVRAIIVQALPTQHEEFFDLVLLAGDEDSNFGVPNQQMTGNEKALVLRGIWAQGVPTSFVDGYEDEGEGVASTYLVRVEDFRDMRVKQGEGRFFATLRVL